MKSKLVPCGTIKKAVSGDTASPHAVQQHDKPYTAYLSHKDTDLNDRLNSKLLEAVLTFKLDYQPPGK